MSAHDEAVEAARFWGKVERRGDDQCWPWRGASNRRGYGQIWWRGRRRVATQVSWELATGSDFPSGLFACHHCDNPTCVNPRHIWAATQSENMKDCFDKNRSSITANNGGRWVQAKAQTACKHGHPFTPENTMLTKGGRHRQCRTCHNKVTLQGYHARRKRRAATLANAVEVPE